MGGVRIPVGFLLRTVRGAEMKRRYIIHIIAEDGHYTHHYATLEAMRKAAEKQVGGTLENRYDFAYNDGSVDFRPLNLADLDACEKFVVTLVDDWGRRITFGKEFA